MYRHRLSATELSGRSSPVRRDRRAAEPPIRWRATVSSSSSPKNTDGRLWPLVERALMRSFFAAGSSSLPAAGDTLIFRPPLESAAERRDRLFVLTVGDSGESSGCPRFRFMLVTLAARRLFAAAPVRLPSARIVVPFDSVAFRRFRRSSRSSYESSASASASYR
uniref:Uncharacterized protein n=1 Tax=Anopheles minimus TaxID=112268 RepID=A0A182W5K4_9DIPT